MRTVSTGTRAHGARIILTGIALNVMVVLPLSAVTVTNRASPPASYLIVSNSTPADNFGWVFSWTADSSSGHQELGQSFQVPGTNYVTLDNITVRVREMGSSVTGQPFFVQIWRVSDGGDYTGDTLVSEQSGVFPSGLAGYSWWTFDIDDVVLSNGACYAFMLGFTNGPAADQSVTLVNDQSAQYGGGRMMGRTYLPPMTWVARSYDLEFYLQGYEGVTVSIWTAVELTWPSAVNASYILQWTTNLESGVWHSLGDPVIGTGQTNSVLDSIRGKERCFYRVVTIL